MTMHEGHRARMRRRFLDVGLAGFDDHSILELLLFYAQPRKNTNETAHLLMQSFGSLDAVFEAKPEALMKVPGVGESAAVLIRLVPEAARRYLMAKEEGGVLVTAEDAGKFLIPRFTGARSECVYLVCLDAKLKVIDCRCLADGGATATAFNVRAIAEIALTRNASGVILAHNHTSGIALPSREDKQATLRLRDALTPLGITLVDHLVIAGDEFVSMAESGILQ